MEGWGGSSRKRLWLESILAGGECCSRDERLNTVLTLNTALSQGNYVHVYSETILRDHKRKSKEKQGGREIIIHHILQVLNVKHPPHTVILHPNVISIIQHIFAVPVNVWATAGVNFKNTLNCAYPLLAQCLAAATKMCDPTSGLE